MKVMLPEQVSVALLKGKQRNQCCLTFRICCVNIVCVSCSSEKVAFSRVSCVGPLVALSTVPGSKCSSSRGVGEGVSSVVSQRFKTQETFNDSLSRPGETITIELHYYHGIWFDHHLIHQYYPIILHHQEEDSNYDLPFQA